MQNHPALLASPNVHQSHDARMGPTEHEHQLAEVLVERNQDTFFFDAAPQDLLIPGITPPRGYALDVVSCGPKLLGSRSPDA